MRNLSVKKTISIWNSALSYPQAALGDEIEVPTVQGNVNLKIPAGTQTGTRFRLERQRR